MSEFQEMYNQVNAVIHFLPKEDRSRLPVKLISFFKRKANKKPEEVIDMNKELDKQRFNNDTIIMLYYINSLIKD